MLVDTDKLRAFIDSEIAECTRSIEQGMCPQGDDDVRDERRDLRALRDALGKVERLVAKMPRPAAETCPSRESKDA